MNLSRALKLVRTSPLSTLASTGSAAMVIGLLVAVITGVVNAVMTQSAVDLPQPITAGAGAAQLDLDTQFLKPDIARIALTLTVDAIDVQAQTTNVHLSLEVPPSLIPVLVPVLGGQADGLSTLPAAELLVTLPSTSALGATQVLDRPLSSSDFTEALTTNVPVAQFAMGDVPLESAAPAEFPFDSYRLSLVAQIVLLAGQTHDIGDVPVTALPLEPLVAVSPTLADFAESTSIVGQHYPMSKAGWDSSAPARSGVTTASLTVAFTRSMSQWLLTAVTASIPLVLACVFLSVLIAQHRVPSLQGRALDYLIGIAAALLAILPLRATLLPSAIQTHTLTLLDTFLALQAAVLVLLASVHTLLWLGALPRPQARRVPRADDR